MRVRTRLQWLEQWCSPGGAGGRAPSVEVWLPENGRDGRPPGRYPCPGSNAVLAGYQPEQTRIPRPMHHGPRPSPAL